MISGKTWLPSLAIFDDLFLAKAIVYDRCDLTLTHFKVATESKAYGACTFHINDVPVEFRIAKATPKKTGHFVTIWKRDNSGKTVPLHISDDFDFIIISTRKQEQLGQFVFPKSILYNKGVLAADNQRGKCGIRVYAPWEEVRSAEARSTQQWQSPYFVEISNSGLPDFSWLKKLW